MRRSFRHRAFLVLGAMAGAGIALAASAWAQADNGAVATDRTNPLVEQPAVVIDGADKAPMLAIAHAGPRLVAVGEHGIVLLSDDGGAHFRQARAVPTRTTLNAVNFVSDSDGWIAGHWGVILHTTDGGETWSIVREDMTVDQPLFSILFTDPGHGFAVGLWSLMLATQDGGKTWAPVTLPTPKGSPKADKNLYQILSDGKGLMLIAAEQGYVYRSSDGGRSWSVVETGNPGSFWTGLILDDGAILLGGLSGGLSRSTDHGQSWSRVDTRTKSSITGMAQAADGHVIAVGLDGISLDSADRGKTFALHVRDDQRPLNAVAINAKGVPVIASAAGISAGS